MIPACAENYELLTQYYKFAYVNVMKAASLPDDAGAGILDSELGILSFRVDGRRTVARFVFPLFLPPSPREVARFRRDGRSDSFSRQGDSSPEEEPLQDNHWPHFFAFPFGGATR